MSKLDDIEVWEDVPGYPNYKVSNLGEVVNVKSNRNLKPFVNDKSGTLAVDLFHNSRGHKFILRRLVAALFLSDYSPKLHVLQLNGNQADCSVGNLIMAQRGNTKIAIYGHNFRNSSTEGSGGTT